MKIILGFAVYRHEAVKRRCASTGSDVNHVDTAVDKLLLERLEVGFVFVLVGDSEAELVCTVGLVLRHVDEASVAVHDGVFEVGEHFFGRLLTGHRLVDKLHHVGDGCRAVEPVERRAADDDGEILVRGFCQSDTPRYLVR